MREWMSPEGITALVTLLLLLISVAKNVAQALGKKELATQLEGAEQKAGTMAKVAGTLIKGVERVKREGKVDPKGVTALVETLREENLIGGVEHLVKPIVEEARAAPLAGAETIVKQGTARLDRRVS